MVGNGHKSGPEYILGSEMDSKCILWVHMRCWEIVCGWPGQVPRKGGAPQGPRRGPLTQTTFTEGGSIGIIVFSNVTKSHQMVGNGQKGGPEYILGSEMHSKWIVMG